MAHLHAQDQEFLTPFEKSPPNDSNRINSTLAVLSLIFGILGVVGLPVLGSIIAVITGHAAIRQIRESGDRLEGRSFARAGLWLGYLALVIAVIAGLIVAGFVVYAARSMPMPPAATPAAPILENGVKMVNEMDRADFELIRNANLDIPDAEIIACYNAGGFGSDPEFALVTTKKLIYMKDGRTTEFDFKDIVHLKNDEAFEKTYNIRFNSYELDLSTYHIEVISQQGPRMHIAIKPEKGGTLFFDALTRAIQSAGVRLTPA